jgi:hypothetical protein
MPLDSPGLLIIRARLEQGSSSPLRAEVRFTKAVSGRFKGTVNLSDVDAVVGTVREWLQDVVQYGSSQLSPTDTDVAGDRARPSSTVEEEP